MAEVVVSPSLFARLPASVGSSILSKWFEMKSLGRLDSAYCNHEERGRFTEMLQHKETFDICCPPPAAANVPSRSYERVPLMIRWLIMRNVKCSNITIRAISIVEAAVASELVAYLQFTAHFLKRVSIACDHKATARFLQRIALDECCLNCLDIRDIEEVDDRAEGHADIQTILTNSASSLTEFTFVKPPSHGSLQFLDGMCLPALSKVVTCLSADDDLLHMCKAAPNLREITVPHIFCPEMHLEVVGQYCSGLQSLQILGESSDTTIDTGLVAVANGCPQLKHLTLQLCEGLTDVGLMAVAVHCTTLAELAVSYNSKITDKSLEALAVSLGPHLVTLSIVHCSQFTGAGLIAIATHCTSLRVLHIGNWCTTTLTRHFAEAIPFLSSLRTLIMTYYPVDDAMLNLIANHMPNLEHFDIACSEAKYSVLGLMAIVHMCAGLLTLRILKEMPDVSKFVATHRPKLRIVTSCQ